MEACVCPCAFFLPCAVLYCFGKSSTYHVHNGASNDTKRQLAAWGGHDHRCHDYNPIEKVCLSLYPGEFFMKDPNFFSCSLVLDQVLIFSFMGDFRGRIIHAYFDGTHVIVRKTKLYHFYPVEKARKTFELFLRQMASMPIGDIKAQSQEIVRPSTPSSIEIDLNDLSFDSD